MRAGDNLRFNIRLSQVPEYHPEPEPNPICTHSPNCQGCPYGEQRMTGEFGKFSDYGYIAYKGFVSLEELMAGIQSERFQMGGMK